MRLYCHLFASDPTCRQLSDGKFWVFATHDQSSTHYQCPPDYWDNMYSYQAYSTEDFLNWTQHGSILSIFDVPWASANAVWDGDAGIPMLNHFLAYIPVRCVVDSRWEFSIAAMIAEKPEGPYVDALGKPFISKNDLVHQLGDRFLDWKGECVSPVLVNDDFGNPWLLFGQFNAFLMPLSQDGLSAIGPIRELEVPRFLGEAHEYIEGPMLNKIGSRWYFSYMTYKNWQGKRNSGFSASDPDGPYIRICESDNFCGPFRNPQNLIYPRHPNDCNVQHCIASFREKWIIAYHLPWNCYSDSRMLRFATLRLDDHLRPIPFDPNDVDDTFLPPVSNKVLFAAAAKRFAQECHSAQNVLFSSGPKKARVVAFLPGGHIRFDDLVFEDSPYYIELEFFPFDGVAPSGNLEIRLDDCRGPLLAQLPLSKLNATLKARLNLSHLSGVHSLLFVESSKHGTGSCAAPSFQLLSFRILPAS